MNLKALYEKRNKLLADMQKIVDAANTETRSFTNDELASYEQMKADVAALDRTIEASEELRSIARKSGALEPDAREKNDTVLKEKAFENYLRGKLAETRDDPAEDVNLTYGDNGAVIPTSIANKIIDKVVEISPLFSMATRYNVKGSLTIPYYDGTTSDITVAYADEFTDLTSTSGSFKSITLTGFLAGVLTKVSKSLLNNSNFDLLGFVIKKMAENIAVWIEGELIKGTSHKIDGLSTLSAAVTAEYTTKVSADELIDLQEAIPDAYQANAVWIMNKATRKSIRKLKDGQGNYLLERDFTGKWNYTLLGKPVMISKNMPTMAAGAKAVYYGDMSGLAVKVSEEAQVTVLREKFATQHAVGVVAYVELDSKVENAEKIAMLKMAASDPQ
ncbi:MAG: phage major capsid protein [Ruminococcus sp.]|nr:phage major capsid protein [Ruminococcus sp.]